MTRPKKFFLPTCLFLKVMCKSIIFWLRRDDWLWRKKKPAKILAVHSANRHHCVSVTLALCEQKRVMEWPCDVCPRLNFIRADSVSRLLCVAVKPHLFTSSIEATRKACSNLGNKQFRDRRSHIWSYHDFPSNKWHTQLFRAHLSSWRDE